VTIDTQRKTYQEPVLIHILMSASRKCEQVLEIFRKWINPEETK